MSRTKQYVLEGTDADADGAISAEAPTAHVAMPLEAAAAAMTPARRIVFTTAGDLSTIEFTIFGFGPDVNGNGVHAQSESFKGLSSTSPRTTLKRYSSITKVVPNGTSAVTLDAGWILGAISPWIQVGRTYGWDAVSKALANAITLAGVPTGNWEGTYSEFPRLPPEQISIDTSVAWVSGTPVEIGAQGCRFVLTSGAGTSVTLRVTRPGP